MSASGNPLASLIVRFVAESEDFTKGIGDISSNLEDLGQRALKFGADFAEGLSFVEITKEVFEAGETFENAFAKIERATGAVGEPLKGLEDSFAQTFGNVTQGADDVAAGLALLSQRTGLTGDSLNSLLDINSKLAQVLDQQLRPTIESTQKILIAFGVTVDEQPAKLDALLAIAQKSGANFNSLVGSLQTVGPTLRAMGLDLADSAALLANFETHGVNAGRVASTLNATLVNLAKEGFVDTVATGDTLAGIGQSAADAASSASEAAGSAATAASSVADSAGSISSATGAIGSSIAPLAGIVTGAISAVTGVIGVFQQARQETTLNAIELNTRITSILLGSIDDTGKGYQDVDNVKYWTKQIGVTVMETKTFDYEVLHPDLIRIETAIGKIGIPAALDASGFSAALDSIGTGFSSGMDQVKNVLADILNFNWTVLHADLVGIWSGVKRYQRFRKGRQRPKVQYHRRRSSGRARTLRFLREMVPAVRNRGAQLLKKGDSLHEIQSI